MTTEMTRLRVGFVPLCDSAPLIVAREMGFFAEQGLDVELSREPSWANIRDKLAVGLLDAAQMLATLPLSATLGLGNVRAPMLTALGLNIGGNAITVSDALWQRMAEADPAAMAARPLTARALKRVIVEDQAAGRPPLVFATVYPFSPHNYELRYWLAAAGIDPDRDLRLVVVPPPQMVSNLAAGSIAGYCVGEPWNAMAAALGLGHPLISSRELWGLRLEKVLGVRQDWAEANPAAHGALLRALLLACRWLDEAGHRAEAAEMAARPAYLDARTEVVRAVLERPGDIHFHRHAANFPWRSQALWYLAQMSRWGQLPAEVDLAQTAARVYRTDLHRAAAAELGFPLPEADSKIEGAHGVPWTLAATPSPIAMPPDRLLDGASFDPAKADFIARTYASQPLGGVR